MLKFTNLEKNETNWQKFEVKMRETIDRAFTPTQQRVLEL